MPKSRRGDALELAGLAGFYEKEVVLQSETQLPCLSPTDTKRGLSRARAGGAPRLLRGHGRAQQSARKRAAMLAVREDDLAVCDGVLDSL